MPTDYPHLNDVATDQMAWTAAERIRSIQEGSWLPYARAKEVIGRMEDLLNYPRITRMPNMLLVGPSFSGKTSILERFVNTHPPDIDPDGECTICPVVMVEAPTKPDASDFYSRILQALMSPYKPTSSPAERYYQVKVLFAQLKVRLLIIDEIQHLIAGSLNRQREFRNAIKSLGNETKVTIVAAGVEDAFNAFNIDPQMSSRFVPEVLTRWRADETFGSLLATLERRTPLRYPSGLDEPGLMLRIHSLSEGMLGDFCDLIKTAAIDAIRSGAERITLDQIADLQWTPPSKRKQSVRPN
ncbi:TniB family NTP-binding protein [Herbaspirillum sp. RTI4]|nr:TniB family NTP-binding protein [Herbaspirillum sp. RTI4]MDY7577271.1 TniB family NTP-binding protein [Herbaspirillum sp. RTI4]